MGKIGVDFWKAPSWEHPFGTDYYNRDIMSRVFFGTRIALFVAVVVVALSMIIGVPLGAFAGYYGGLIDEVIMRITDIFLAFPALLLAMVLSVTLGPNLMNAMFAIAIAWWPWYTRIMRNMVLSLRERAYVMAAKAAGIKNLSIITKFILPNSLAPIIVQATLDMGTVILAEAALAFLGLGAKPPTPDWGLMISQEATYITQGIWWPSVFPGIFIFLTVISFNLIGDALREFLDPKVRLKRFR
jgi:peptide/nickel transport system permease protein